MPSPPAVVSHTLQEIKAGLEARWKSQAEENERKMKELQATLAASEVNRLKEQLKEQQENAAEYQAMAYKQTYELNPLKESMSYVDKVLLNHHDKGGFFDVLEKAHRVRDVGMPSFTYLKDLGLDGEDVNLHFYGWIEVPLLLARRLDLRLIRARARRRRSLHQS